ncbi:MAG: hypothetical protein ACREAS_06455, partial [Nitrososphaera sp.]
VLILTSTVVAAVIKGREPFRLICNIKRMENKDPNLFLLNQSFRHFSSDTTSEAPNGKIRRTDLP